MALSKKEEQRVSAKVYSCLTLVVAVVLLVLGVVCWKMGTSATSMVNKGLVDEKIYFPPSGTPMFDASVFPKAQKYAGKQVVDGTTAKAYADDFLGVQLKQVGAGKTTAEVAGMAAVAPTDMALQQQAAIMTQLNTSKTLLLTGAYAQSVQAKMMTNAGMGMLVVGGVLLLSCAYYCMRYRQLS